MHGAACPSPAARSPLAAPGWPAAPAPPAPWPHAPPGRSAANQPDLRFIRVPQQHSLLVHQPRALTWSRVPRTPPCHACRHPCALPPLCHACHHSCGPPPLCHACHHPCAPCLLADEQAAGLTCWRSTKSPQSTFWLLLLPWRPVCCCWCCSWWGCSSWTRCAGLRRAALADPGRWRMELRGIVSTAITKWLGY